MRKSRLTGLIALGAAATLALAGCASDNGGTGEEPGATDGPRGTITLGYIGSWTDGLSTAYLLDNQLTKLGYEVVHEDLSNPAVLYTGLGDGAIDIYPSAWPEVTHAEYMAQQGDNVVSLGAYYDGAALTITVPAYVDIDSLAELAENRDRFNGDIIGIEPGAGLTGVTEDMMPVYGLDDWNLVTSSTATMITELRGAIADQSDIVVTLWRPFWPYGEMDLKDLQDPEGAMGDTESLHFLANHQFAASYPDAADLIAGIRLDDVAFGALESLVTSDEFAGNPAGAVEQWVAENAGAFPTLIP